MKLPNCKSETDLKFFISTRKCPFATYESGAFRYCDPDCMACVIRGEDDYMCLRLLETK